MALSRKYANLPDLVSNNIPRRNDEDGANHGIQDSAPDIYETPELTDDASTVPVRGSALVPHTVPY